MLICAGCSAAVPDGSVRCLVCGEPLASTEPTVVEGWAPAEVAERGSSGRGRGGPRFATGTVLASRYRIVARLGHGGMGEVYRADDLKLNHHKAVHTSYSTRKDTSTPSCCKKFGQVIKPRS